MGNRTRAGLSKMTPHRYAIGRHAIEIYDHDGSCAADYIAAELAGDSYGLRDLPLAPGDNVLDIGGHIGLFAIYLAMQFPGIHIYSYEPHPDNFSLFQTNLARNQITNVRLYPEAVSGDGRRLTLSGNPANSGAPTAHSVTLDHLRVSGIRSMTMDQILERDGVERWSLLKIDCEGSEYEALETMRGWKRVGRLCGEFHSNQLLESRGHSPESLLKYCQDRLGADRVTVSFCGMSE